MSGNFIITWSDRRNGNFDVYAQRYSNDGMTFGSNYRISNTGEMEQYGSVVVLGNTRIYATWEDNWGGQTGFNIWANVLDWENSVGIKNNLPFEISSKPCLYQNYPNPFCFSTKIFYSLNKPNFVSLNIYKMLGRKIKSLVNEFQNANTYSVNIDGSELPGGIYFYKLKVGDEYFEVKKMMLMR